ncbi:MAG: response regulator transcription factor [Porticoccaceae bacterium]|nr:response regulator transcription factor [Porticoccaceae bacterium]
MIKVLIVDDELMMEAHLEGLIAAIKNIGIVGTAANSGDAIALANQQQPDIVLIKLPVPFLDGIPLVDLLQQSGRLPVLIFCPSFKDFESKPVTTKCSASFRMKLLSPEDLLGALLAASKLIHKMRQEQSTEPRQHLYAYSYLGIEKIPVEKILLFQADEKYVKAYESGSAFTINDSLKSLEEEFKPRFFRIHRNTLVAVEAIEGLVNMDGSLRISVSGLSIQPSVSRRRASKLRQLLRLL